VLLSLLLKALSIGGVRPGSTAEGLQRRKQLKTAEHRLDTCIEIGVGIRFVQCTLDAYKIR
jgi:hypothetical protein